MLPADEATRVAPVVPRALGTREPRWRPSVLTACIAALALVGIVVGLYPSAAAWLSSYNQSLLVESYTSDLSTAEPTAAQQLEAAHRYNEALSTGVIVVGENARLPVAQGSASTAADLDYEDMLTANDTGIMARVKIPAIGVDLPVYHGTSDDVLAEGAGHLEGSSLPVGGAGTRAVITAHRGLATATLFTDLDQVKDGDMFTIEVFGEVLSYRVNQIQVIAPEDTDSLRAVPGEDLVTLITCTPLGINSHRIVVTGERVTPTPERDLAAAGAAPEIPGFPWWIVVALAGLLLVCGYTLRQGFVDAAARGIRPRPESSASNARPATALEGDR